MREAYNQWAAIYDSNDNKTRDMDERVARDVIGSAAVDTIVELGCGTGKNTEWLAEQCSTLIGLDLSEEMLAVARKKIPASHVELRQTNLLDTWQLPTASAQLITTNLVLEHLPDLMPVVEQAANVLAPRGRLYISELHPYKHLLGGGARFDVKEATTFVTSKRHHISDYLHAAHKAGLQLLRMDEWFDDDERTLPRLATFLFQKPEAEHA